MELLGKPHSRHAGFAGEELAQGGDLALVGREAVGEGEELVEDGVAGCVAGGLASGIGGGNEGPVGVLWIGEVVR